MLNLNMAQVDCYVVQIKELQNSINDLTGEDVFYSRTTEEIIEYALASLLLDLDDWKTDLIREKESENE